MFDLAVLVYVLLRQYWLPVVVVAGSLWSWSHYADSSLIPENKYTRQLQSYFYQIKYHPVTRKVMSYVVTPDFTGDVRNLAVIVQNAAGLDKVNAIKALGLLEGNSAHALPTLVWTLYDRNPAVRKAALDSIPMVATPETLSLNNDMLPVLQELLKHPDTSVQKVAAAMLGGGEAKSNLGPLNAYTN